MRLGSRAEGEKLRLSEMQLFLERKNQAELQRENQRQKRDCRRVKQGFPGLSKGRRNLQKMQKRRMLFLDCSNALGRRGGDEILQVHEM